MERKEGMRRKEESGGLGHEKPWAKNSEVEMDPSSLHHLYVHMEIRPFHEGSRLATDLLFSQSISTSLFNFFLLQKIFYFYTAVQSVNNAVRVCR